MNRFKFKVSGFKFQVVHALNRIAGLILFVLFSSTSHAQDSLAVYLELAGKNNPGVKAAFSQYLAALEKVPQVGSLPDPQGSLDFFLKPMELLNGNQVGSISVMQMFPWFGTLKLAKDEASLMAKAQFSLFQESKAGLFYNVKTSWYQLAKYKRGILLINQNIALLESIEKLALVKFQSPAGSSSGSSSGSGMQGTLSATGNASGMGSMNNQPAVSNQPQPKSNMSSEASGGMGSKSTGLADVLRIRMEILDQKNQLSSLIDQLKTEEANFNSLLNRDQNLEIEIPDSLKMETLSVSALAVADSILSNNPMLAMLDAEGQSYSAMADKARKMGLPMVGVGVNYMVIQKQAGNMSMMNGSDMVMPMLNFTIPIYRKKYTAMQKEANYLQESTMLKSDEMKNMLLLEYRQLMQNYSDAKRRVELYKEQADLANRTANLLLAGFTSNGTDFEEILRIQYKVLEYGLKHIEAVADYNMAVAKAEKLMNKVNY
jgi:outer membrane protein TolC